MNAFHPKAVAEARFDQLPGNWRTSRLTVRASRLQGLEAGVSLPARLRGALGHALLARQSDKEWEAARRILFDPIPWRRRAELPKPYVIAVSEEGREISVELTLFGVADRWRQPIFDALMEALARGITLDSRRNAQRRALPVHHAEWTRAESISVPPPSTCARLLFRTPLRLGGGHRLGVRWSDVIVSLAERAAGLAIWQGLAVDPVLGRWRTLANSIVFSDDALRPVFWDRRSGAQGGREVPMGGYLGPLDIRLPPEEMMPLLALGETAHVGGGASLGLGRYDLL